MQPVEATPRTPQSTTYGIILSIVVLALVSAAIGYGLVQGGGTPPVSPANAPAAPLAVPPRQATVAARGANVMPFDLTKTTHTFTDTASGGIETVTANDPGDSTQVGLIRMHLQQEAVNFNQGNYADPASIHGPDMPGLTELEAGARHIRVGYRDLPAGAQLTYSSLDVSLVAALHQWYAAQRNDHNGQGPMNMDMRRPPGIKPTPTTP